VIGVQRPIRGDTIADDEHVPESLDPDQCSDVTADAFEHALGHEFRHRGRRERVPNGVLGQLLTAEEQADEQRGRSIGVRAQGECR
jgi:hypothetical protein